MSPDPALGRRFSLPPMLQTAMMCRFLAPELSAQLTTAATGRPAETRCLIPDAAERPRGPLASDIVQFRDVTKMIRLLMKIVEVEMLVINYFLIEIECMLKQRISQTAVIHFNYAVCDPFLEQGR